MKAPPQGWPRLSASVFYDDPKAAIEWLCRTFGFELRLKVEGDGGEIVHAEVTFGEGLVMVGSSHGDELWQKMYRSPKSIGGGITQALAFFVDDVDQHHAVALAAGANIVRALDTSDYGDDYWSDRSYGATDLEGHLWWFMQRMRG